MLPETRQYRRDTQSLTADLVRDWAKLWPALDLAALDASFPRWLVVAAALVGRSRAAAVLLAVEYMRNFSDFSAVPGEALNPAQFATAMRVTTVVSVKRAMGNGLSLQDAGTLAFSASVGSSSRLVLNAGRGTVMATSVADPACEGWKRVGVGSCEFCRMLISRGSIYTEATADFRSHDRCHCSAEPVYS